MNYVVAFDISSNKRRKKLGDLLGKYGARVNYSVFEIEVNKTKLKYIMNEIEKKDLVNEKYDSLRFYHICQNCIPKSFEICRREDIFEVPNMFI